MQLRQTARDERRQELALAQKLEQSICERIAKIDNGLTELRNRTDPATGLIDIDRLRDTVRYQSLLAVQRQAAQRELEGCRAHMDRLRQLLVEADRELKSLEKLQSRHQDHHRHRQRKSELGQLDEAGIRIAATGEFSR